jgi:hypothetical protein
MLTVAGVMVGIGRADECEAGALMKASSGGEDNDRS